MIFRIEREETGRGKKALEKQYAQVSVLCRRRLLGYAESFRELARSFQGEWPEELPGTDRQSLLEERRLWENRQVMGNNLEEVAQIMAQVAGEELIYCPLEARKRKNLVHALHCEGLEAEELCYLFDEPGEQGRKSLGMNLFTDRKGGIPAAEVADMLTVLLAQKLQVSSSSPYLVDEEPRSFVFVEEPCYLALTGISRAVKEGEAVSGDHYSLLESEKGKLTVLLSDGTGSGERASEGSSRVLDLMEKMLEAGFGVEASVNMVNSALFARGEERDHPTLDICSLDLYQGYCDICKVGGAASFLKREKQVETLARGTLPLGIFQSVQTNLLRRNLQDGDYLILMTDGVLDALEEVDCEEAMEETLKELTERNPQEIADKLLSLVLRACGGRIRDDMTILVIGIWKT